MRSYMAKNLLAASSAVTVSSIDKDLGINNNEPFLDNFHLEFTTQQPTTPRSNDDESLAAEKNEIDEELGFGVIITLLFCIGVIVNIGCMISLRRHRSTFHRFLKMLACFDGLVVTCIFLMYALPVMSYKYKKTIFLPMVPFFLPLVHMALMGSVYSTIVMSLERYLRLCKVKTMSKRTVTGCIWFVVIFPMIFYTPKFLEYRYQKFVHSFPVDVNCSHYVAEQRELLEFDQRLQWESTTSISGPIRHYNRKNITISPPKVLELASASGLPPPPSNLYSYPIECLDFNFDVFNESDDFVRTLEEKRTVFYPNATEVRRNPYYYTIYCVALNTCFATLLPLTALIYLNCMTLRALRVLGKATASGNGSNVNSRQLETIIEENSSQHSRRIRTPAMTNTSGDRANYRFICGFEHPTTSSGGLNGGHPGDQGPQVMLQDGNEIKIRYDAQSRQVQIEHKDSFLHSYENLLRKKESRLTRISICIVWLFIICHVWKLIPTIYELLYSEDGLELPRWPGWLVTIKHLSHTLIAFNSAVNFLIYAIL